MLLLYGRSYTRCFKSFSSQIRFWRDLFLSGERLNARIEVLFNMSSKIKVIDLFCGIGGLTHGLIKEGLDVVAGIDNDSSCKFGYEYNNKTQFIDTDILKVTTEQINKLFGSKKGTIRVLAGCAPCQPFSKLN